MLPSITAFVALLGTAALADAMNVRAVWKHHGCVRIADVPFDLTTAMPESRDRASRCQATCQSYKYAAVSNGKCHCGNALGETSIADERSCDRNSGDEMVFAKMYVLARSVPVHEAHSDPYAPPPDATPPCGIPVSATAESTPYPGEPDIPDLTPTGVPPTLSPLPPWPAPSAPAPSDVFGGDVSEYTPPTGDVIPWIPSPSVPCSSDETTLVISVTATSARTTTVSCPNVEFPACSDQGSGSGPSTGESFIPYPLSSSPNAPPESSGLSTVTLPYEAIPSGGAESSGVPSNPSDGADEPSPTAEEPATEAGRGARQDASLLAVLLAVLFSAILL